jgi:hypothetical protein
MDFKNDFSHFKKLKIFGFQKKVEILSIFKECVDMLSLLLEKLCALNRKCCGHGTFQKIQTMSARADISALILMMHLNSEAHL